MIDNEEVLRRITQDALIVLIKSKPIIFITYLTFSLTKASNAILDAGFTLFVIYIVLVKLSHRSTVKITNKLTINFSKIHISRIKAWDIGFRNYRFFQRICYLTLKCSFSYVDFLA